MTEFLFKSQSQARQDRFVHLMLENQNQNQCVYLELGASTPININNTYNLEQLGWKGLSFDIETKLVPLWKEFRTNELLIKNTITTNWENILQDYSFLQKNPIDYLSFDVDDASEKTFKNFPFDKIKFKIITMEHNLYFGPNNPNGGTQLKKLSSDTFKSLGYICICENITHGNNPYEDWWIDPQYINESIYQKYISQNKEGRFWNLLN